MYVCMLYIFVLSPFLIYETFYNKLVCFRLSVNVTSKQKISHVNKDNGDEHSKLCIYYTNIIQILYKYYTNVIQILYKYYTNIIQILYKYYTNIIQKLYIACKFIISLTEMCLLLPLFLI